MNETLTDAQRQKMSSREMLAKATAAKDAYLAELAKYPNIQAEAKQIDPTSPWTTKWNIQVHSNDAEHGEGWRDVLNIQVVNERWTKLVFMLDIERYVYAGGRNCKRRYHKLDAANLRKIAKEVAELEQSHVEYRKKTVAAQDVSGQWQAVRRSKLTGLAIHPCLLVSIMEKATPPTAEDAADPKFVVDFNTYTTNRINNYSLTAGQVSKLCRVLAEITGLDSAWAIVKVLEDKVVGAWNGGWFTRALTAYGSWNAKAFPTREAAQTELDRIVALNGQNREGAKIVPFYQTV